MSRVGKNPVVLPEGVTAEVQGQNVKVKGPKGELSLRVHDKVGVKIEDGEGGKKQIRLTPLSEDRKEKMLWPTFRAHINNMVKGVKTGYTKVLELHGVGYRANLQGQTLVMTLGYSHDIKYAIPKGISMIVDKQTKITITGIDRQMVGQVAADIVTFRPPEPYKGKGIRYEKQFILRKEGKKK